MPAEVLVDLYTLDDFYGESVQLNVVPTGSCVAFPYEFQDNVESLTVGGDIWTCSFWVYVPYFLACNVLTRGFHINRDIDCNSYDSVFIVEGGGEFSDLGDYFDNNLNAVSCVPSE